MCFSCLQATWLNHSKSWAGFGSEKTWRLNTITKFQFVFFAWKRFLQKHLQASLYKAGLIQAYTHTGPLSVGASGLTWLFWNLYCYRFDQICQLRDESFLKTLQVLPQLASQLSLTISLHVTTASCLYFIQDQAIYAAWTVMSESGVARRSERMVRKKVCSWSVF